MYQGPVTLYVTGQVSVTGTGAITVAEEEAEKFALYVASSEAVHLAGPQGFRGVVYAPQSLVDIAGQGEVSGAVVGNAVRVSGEVQVRYDKSLKGQ